MSDTRERKIEGDNIRWKEDGRRKGFYLIVEISGLEAPAVM